MEGSLFVLTLDCGEPVALGFIEVLPASLRSHKVPDCSSTASILFCSVWYCTPSMEGGPGVFPLDCGEPVALGFIEVLPASPRSHKVPDCSSTASILFCSVWYCTPSMEGGPGVFPLDCGELAALGFIEVLPVSPRSHKVPDCSSTASILFCSVWYCTPSMEGGPGVFPLDCGEPVALGFIEVLPVSLR